MAVDIQDIVATPFLRALVSRVPEDIKPFTSEPTAELIHVGSSVLDGGSVGNEAALNLKFPLPVNYGYAIQTLLVVKRGSDASWGFDQPPILTLYVAANELTPQANSTQIDVPMGASGHVAISAPADTISSVTSFFLGGGAMDASRDSVVPWGQPYPVQFGYWDSLTQTGTIPSFTIGVDVQDVAAGTVDWYARWLVYDLAQFSNTGLNWRIPVT